MPYGRWITVLLALLLALAACKKEDKEDDLNANPDQFRELRVTVKHVYTDSTGLQDSLVPVATVVLYKTDWDLEFDDDRQATGLTDSAGLAHFRNLKEDRYYLRVTHATLGAMEDSVSTPVKSVSLLEILYQ